MIREIKNMDLSSADDMFQLASYAFNVEGTEKRKERFKYQIAHSINYGYFIDNSLVSQAVVIPFKVNFHGVTYKMAGISCISTYPEHRGEGIVSEIMTTLLKEQGQQKVALAYLAPFSYPFYRKYGFEQVFERIKYTIPSEKWPNVSTVSGNVRRISWQEARKIIQQLHLNMKGHQRGAIIREEWWLDVVFTLKESYQFVVYESESGEIEGYLVYRASSEVFRIKEWGYQSKNAFQALAKFIGSHKSSSNEFFYESGFDGSNLSHFFPDPTIKIKINPDMMAKIVRFDSFLNAYPFQPGKKEVYYLDVTDLFGSWNEGIWKLTINELGKGKIKKIDKKPHILSDELSIICGSIQTWTQLFLGARSAQELYFHEKLKGKKELVYPLDKRLCKGKPLLEDYF